MKLWDRIKGIKRLGFVSQFNMWDTPPERHTKDYLEAYGEIYSLFGIALRIATAVSEVKWRLYKGSERGERNQITDHPILKLLDFANEFQTGEDVVELLQLHLDLAGKGYWYLPKNGLGVPAEIWVLPPHLVSIVPSKEKFIAGYLYYLGNEKIPIGTDEIIRFSMPDPVNPYGGVGYAQAAAVELDSEIYSGKWNRNFFYNSARPDGALEYEGNLSEEQFKTLREQWASKHQGLSNAHKLAILEGGVKYRQIQIAQKDMDFLELRKQTRENLLFTFGMPLSVMGISENVNRANAEAGNFMFARWVVKPRLVRIKNKLNEQLIPMFPKAKGVEIDFEEIVPETIEQKTKVAESGVKAGIMTINEGRKMHGLDPVSNGDVFLIPFNMMPTPADKPIKPPPSAPPPTPPPAKGFNNDQKLTRWMDYAWKALNYERLMIASLRTMFGEQEKYALRKKLTRNAVLIDKQKAKAQYKDAATNILKDLLEHSIDDATNLIEPEPEHRMVKQEASEWLKTRIGWAAEEVTEETARLLADALAAGFDAGEDIETIARRVRGVFEHCDRSRALKIARTETIMASNEGALEGYEESGVVEKAEFYPAPDACPECEALVGEYPLGEAHGMIPVHPNCRCVFLPVV